MRNDDKARQFFQAAEPLLQQYGFRKTTVEEICRAAGASKRTFYALFRDKSDLLTQMLVTLANDAMETWRAAVDPQAPVTQRISDFIQGYEDFARSHPVFSRCLHVFAADTPDAGVSDCRYGVIAHEHLKPILTALSEMIQAGVASGELRPMDAPTAAWIIDGLLDSMYYVFPQLTGKQGALENPLLARELRAFILNGLRNPEHH